MGALPIGLKSTHDIPTELHSFPTAHTRGPCPLSACSVCCSSGASTALPPAAPQRLGPGLCFRGGARHWVSRRAADLGPRECGRRSSPRAEHPCRDPAPRCLPHYRKPLCAHCVGGVISEGSGDTLRSLLGWNLLSRSDHSPLAAGTGRAFTKAWACDPSQRGCLPPWAATAKRDGN